MEEKNPVDVLKSYRFHTVNMKLKPFKGAIHTEVEGIARNIPQHIGKISLPKSPHTLLSN